MRPYIAFFAAIFFFGLLSGTASAAVLKLSPSAGTFEVGSTFELSLFLDSQGQSVNVVQAVVSFPPDKLQLVSPSTGQSIVGVWTAQPTYDNEKGEVKLQGGIPNGITTSQGLVTRMRFRVRAPGRVLVAFGDDSRVLANDGKGTDLLYDVQNGVYNLVLPPPLGPVAASQTHPEQDKWYANASAVLSWTNPEAVEGYSFMLSDVPVDIPDDTSEGLRESVSYKNLASGTHYFHVKALRDGAWGGITHFAVNVDTEPPAAFPIKIAPGSLTTSRTLLIDYKTTDRHSGISHYEYAIIPLFEVEAAEQSIFVEGEGPQQVTLEKGKYDVVVRSYDKAGNAREQTERLRIVGFPLLLLLLLLGNPVYSLLLIGLFAVLVYFGWHSRKWYHHAVLKHDRKELPEPVKKQLRELQEYRKKYGGTHILLFFAGFALAALSGGFGVTSSHAQEPTEDSPPLANGGLSSVAISETLAPPFITTLSKTISNEDIFYVGGKTDAANIPVTVHLQGRQTGETQTFRVGSDSRGNWFYRHNTFLTAGEYILWAQARLGEEVSPPSPQVQIQVQQTALQFGASRFSYETLYLVFAILLLALNAGLVAYIVFHARHARIRHQAWIKEVHEAEQSVRRGFAVLKRDIERELEIVHKAKLSKELSAEEKRREEQLLKDLAWAEQYIGKEVWDVERAEHTD